MANLQERIDAMHFRDRIWGISFVIAVWAVYVFTFITIWPIVGTGVWIALLVSGTLVLTYNTASITAMLAQYRNHKYAVYEPDIRHLDEQRATRHTSHSNVAQSSQPY